MNTRGPKKPPRNAKPGRNPKPGWNPKPPWKPPPWKPPPWKPPPPPWKPPPPPPCPAAAGAARRPINAREHRETRKGDMPNTSRLVDTIIWGLIPACGDQQGRADIPEAQFRLYLPTWHVDPHQRGYATTLIGSTSGSPNASAD